MVVGTVNIAADRVFYLRYPDTAVSTTPDIWLVQTGQHWVVGHPLNGKVLAVAGGQSLTEVAA